MPLAKPHLARGGRDHHNAGDGPASQEGQGSGVCATLPGYDTHEMEICGMESPRIVAPPDGDRVLQPDVCPRMSGRPPEGIPPNQYSSAHSALEWAKSVPILLQGRRLVGASPQAGTQ